MLTQEHTRAVTLIFEVRCTLVASRDVYSEAFCALSGRAERPHASERRTMKCVLTQFNMMLMCRDVDGNGELHLVESFR